MIFQKFKIIINALLQKILGFHNIENTRESMRYSYKKHVLAAQKGKIPLGAGATNHTTGLYGALLVRYASAGIPKPEPLLWIELAPFLLMNESTAIEALAEYVVCQENPKKGKIEWLSKLVNNSLRTIINANPDYVAMATQVLLHQDIYWRNFLNQETKELLESEFLKTLPPKEEIAPEIYILMDKTLQIKVANLGLMKN